MLELSKGQSIDLNKESGTTLAKVRVGAGWDVAAGKSVDLDLWLVIRGAAPVYFNAKSGPGATLDGDDRTGAGSADGADENLRIDVAALPDGEHTVVVNIYDAVAKAQSFKDVARAFVEIVDDATGTKIANFNMTEAGGDNSALVCGRITKANGALSFAAVGEYSTKDIAAIVTENGGNA